MSLPYYGPPKEFETYSIEECESKLREIEQYPIYSIRGPTWHRWIIFLRLRIAALEYSKEKQKFPDQVLSEAENKAIYEARLSKQK